jgi:hypothetical protein
MALLMKGVFSFIMILALTTPRIIYAQTTSPQTEPGTTSPRTEPGYSMFWSMRFSVHFPINWRIIENLPDTVKFIPPDYSSTVVVNWGSPAPNWILDKSAWIMNMTKQGIIVDKIDNNTQIANHTGLVVSFVDNSEKFSIALTRVNNTVFDFIYQSDIDDFPIYEDNANIMLNSFQINSITPTFLDSGCVHKNWWPIWRVNDVDCPNVERK